LAERLARRQPGQLRVDIVHAAGKVFQERGFDGTSMRDIATAAGTTQSMLYRHFSNKAALFEATVLAPFQEFMHEFVSFWKLHSVSDLPNRELLARFNESLYDLAVENRELFLALLSADAFSKESVGDIAGNMATGIPEIVAQLHADRHDRGWDDVDIDVGGRAVIAMVIGTALLDRFLFEPGAPRPSRERIIAELTEFELRRGSVPTKR
jgi:AcrR family transcriptional regulator